MARFSLLGGLMKALILLPWAALALDLSDIFTIQDGATDGGCDTHRALLEDWLTECSYSLDTALNAIDNASRDIRVRRSMNIFFGINSNRNTGQADRMAVRDEIDRVKNFFDHEVSEQGGGFTYPSEGFWLFCDSRFLAQQQPSDPALDYQGNEMRNSNNEIIAIRDVTPYQQELAKNARIEPWWAGDLTTLNVYIFEEEGGSFCYGEEKGATAQFQPLVQGPDGTAQQGDHIWSVILCPEAFNDDTRPVSYREASNAIRSGTNFATTVPRSATLLHEAFHAIRGGYFDSGEDEEYDLAQAIENARVDTDRALRNPESFVFFIAHMYHLFGEDEGNTPESIPHNWDFAFQTVGRDYLLAAKNPGN